MIIILLEIIIIFSLIRNVKKTYNFAIDKIFWLFFTLQILSLIIYRLDLSILGLEVYYSDSSVYWLTTQNILKGIESTTWNMGYVYYCCLIELTSPLISPIFINISNLLLINISILIISMLMLKEEINKKNIKIYLYITLSNPLIYYSLFRNLKDGLFLFLAVLIVNCIYNLIHKNVTKARKIFYLFITIVLTFYITTVRAWGFLIPLSIAGYFLFKKIFLNKKITLKKFIFTIFLLGILILGIYILLYKFNYIYKLEMWVPIVLENGQTRGIISNSLSIIKILIGPGPIRALFGNEYFMFYTTTGNIMSCVGALLWWFELSFLIANISIKKRNINIIADCLMVIVALFLVIYSLQYGGSLELRFRGVIYVLMSAFLCSKNSFDQIKTNTAVFIIVLLTISFGGIILGT